MSPPPTWPMPRTPIFSRRLNLVKGSRELTNAGSLLFVATPWPGVDYIRRDMPGGDSTLRIEGAGSLLMQVREVEQAGTVANRVTHTAEGFAHGRIRAIPPRTLREAIVNGLVHRDWLTPRPTVIEHVGDTLTVTSPGGFLGGVTPDNIITHPAVPRYRNLSEAMAALGLAEREGIGVDRMVRDMLAIGRSATGHRRDRRPLRPCRVARRRSGYRRRRTWWPHLRQHGPAMSIRFCSSNT